MTKKQKRKLISIVTATVLLIALRFIPLTGWAEAVLYFLPYCAVGGAVLFKAVRNIVKGRIFDENFLMAVATIGAYALRDYPEAVFVMLFYQVGELFESYAVGRSRRSISELMDIRPDYANLEVDGVSVRTDPNDVKVGDVIIVSAGEKIPLDGEIIFGSSSLNTSALTGESALRDVTVGDSVTSGCINTSGLLKIRCTKPFGESTVTKILDLVENAGSKKAKTESFITRFAAVYTPVVVISALLLAVVPPLITGNGWGEWLERGLIFLVISCPCALVISVPLSFFGGIGGASREGILIKGSSYMETLSRVGTVAFDKTGTLTKGSFKVTAVHPEKLSEGELMSMAALAESFSDHPVSASLKAACRQSCDRSRVSGTRELAGQGVIAEIDGRSWAVGNGRLMDSVGADWHPCHCTGTIVHVAADGIYEGHIVISDEIKPQSREAVAALRSQGVGRLVMLTGDGEAVAGEVATAVGVDEFRAGLLPEDKVAATEELMSERTDGSAFAFVGDGINDAPVLSMADVGIAMGGLGSDAAIEAADIVLMDDNPMKLSRAVAISRRTLSIARQNIIFALAVKVLVLILGAAGLAGMWLAVFADVGVSVIAILNAMRTGRALQMKNAERTARKAEQT